MKNLWEVAQLLEKKGKQENGRVPGLEWVSRTGCKVRGLGFEQKGIQEWAMVKWKRVYLERKDFPHSSVGKKSACNAGDLGSIPRSERSPGEGNGDPLQWSCLENPIDRGDWQAIVHGVARVGHDLATKPSPPPPTLTLLEVYFAI